MRHSSRPEPAGHRRKQVAPGSVAIIGSFRQHYQSIVAAVREFEAAGVAVGSPVVSTIINPGADFVRFESDSPESSDLEIEAATLERVLNCDLVYVVAPAGYVGRTTCYELGRVHERAIPVYFSARPLDLPIAIPARSVLSVREIVRTVIF
jgi:hypothetical protein